MCCHHEFSGKSPDELLNMGKQDIKDRYPNLREEFGKGRTKTFKGIVERAQEMKPEVSNWFNDWMSKQDADSLEKLDELPQAETITMGIPEARLANAPQVPAEEHEYYGPDDWYNSGWNHDSWKNNWDNNWRDY